MFFLDFLDDFFGVSETEPAGDSFGVTSLLQEEKEKIRSTICLCREKLSGAQFMSDIMTYQLFKCRSERPTYLFYFFMYYLLGIWSNKDSFALKNCINTARTLHEY